MTDTTPHHETQPAQADDHVVVQTDTQLSSLSHLLGELEEYPTVSSAEKNHQDRLVLGRLGVAASLFTALRAKHPPTAAHCLRVALGCSAWALQLNLSEDERDLIEIAALLHDIGKIGVPDGLLLKPGKLVGDEVLLMDRHRRIGLEILRGFTANNELLNILRYSTAWFDGRKLEFDLKGDAVPFGARMLSIVDAFDAMTTDHVYRKAMSRERAMAELFENAGTQFDPSMVKGFCGFVSSGQVRLEAQVARRWLQEVDLRAANLKWEWGIAKESEIDGAVTGGISGQYHNSLMDSMHDAVMFVDANCRILRWNRAAERLTGIKADALLDRQFDPRVLRMRDEQGEFYELEDCPVSQAITDQTQTLHRISISADGEKRQLNLQVMPVFANAGALIGASVLMHDTSSQVTLEERVQVLHAQATQDPLTSVANRAEFDRSHDQFVEQHLAEGQPCSLIICDIDHFKRINDTFGHQAGDDVLISFAKLLQAHCRSGDLVARYGGEEFVILCAECDNTTATRKAEDFRAALANAPQPALKSQCITASFGVTEMQGGDTPETMLRRADRALYSAKDGGRNRVVQLGSGLVESDEAPPAEGGWLTRFLKGAPDLTLRRTLVAPVPLNITAQKLKGFVADHHAQIVSVNENRALLKLDGANTPLMRRVGDRSVPFAIELLFEEVRIAVEGRQGGSNLKTQIEVVIQPTRKRDRRRQDITSRAGHLLVSLKAYFMAHELTEDPTEESGRAISNFLTGVLGK
ncbi:MAG: diguanylate cyclase [Pirellulaceae bacterium]|jgi:diguanylate cyclase (GGDEF)-like protein/PAS domain S-box-containing protein|nr:diguanylate cyclase [Pirellulaceae bacterium]MDP7020329.1 diguanylate cyclase [Pirellulaceae bacterium]